MLWGLGAPGQQGLLQGRSQALRAEVGGVGGGHERGSAPCPPLLWSQVTGTYYP